VICSVTIGRRVFIVGYKLPGIPRTSYEFWRCMDNYPFPFRTGRNRNSALTSQQFVAYIDHLTENPVEDWCVVRLEILEVDGLVWIPNTHNNTVRN